MSTIIKIRTLATMMEDILMALLYYIKDGGNDPALQLNMANGI